MGTMRTAVGLALGFKAAGLKTRVVAVRVVGEEEASAEKAASSAMPTIANNAFIMRFSIFHLILPDS